MQSNIEKLLGYSDEPSEEEVNDAIEDRPDLDLGAIVQRINDIEEKVNSLIREKAEAEEQPQTPEEAVENSTEGVEEEKESESTETDENNENNEESESD